LTERWVCIDVGETLVDETRIWSEWADELGLPRMTILAAYGAVVERGGQVEDIFDLFGIADWRDRSGSVAERVGALRARDLYPDGRAALDDLRAKGFRVALAANQPARRDAELRALGVQAEVMAMSDAIGVAKPDAAFFDRTLELLGGPEPDRVVYVGDRIDYDVLPSARAGLRAVWLRRGPWGVIPRTPPSAARLVVRSLAELVDRIDEAWA
jgi:HAD superfamily hydrolase (TIGR01549 family)